MSDDAYKISLRTLGISNGSFEYGDRVYPLTDAGTLSYWNYESREAAKARAAKRAAKAQAHLDELGWQKEVLVAFSTKDGALVYARPVTAGAVFYSFEDWPGCPVGVLDRSGKKARLVSLNRAIVDEDERLKAALQAAGADFESYTPTETLTAARAEVRRRFRGVISTADPVGYDLHLRADRLSELVVASRSHCWDCHERIAHDDEGAYRDDCGGSQCSRCQAAEHAAECESLAYAESGGASEAANDYWASRCYDN